VKFCMEFDDNHAVKASQAMSSMRIALYSNVSKTVSASFNPGSHSIQSP
jgi:hypothetical protein